MAFWGVEVKPGKPFTLRADDSRARLHVSQATLGIGGAVHKSVVQCNVGDKSPVFLCSLFPEKAESCQLNLEYEEATDVVFSVIGPRSVHLTGYFLAAGQHRVLNDESESYGEDIANTESEKSLDDDDYDDSFINDGDEGILEESSVSEVSKEVEVKKLSNGSRKRRRLKQKYQVSDSDDDHKWKLGVFSNSAGATANSETLNGGNEENAVIPPLCKNNSLSKYTESEGKEKGDVMRGWNQSDEQLSEREDWIAENLKLKSTKLLPILPDNEGVVDNTRAMKKRRVCCTESSALGDDQLYKDSKRHKELAGVLDGAKRVKKERKKENRQEQNGVKSNEGKSHPSTIKCKKDEMKLCDEKPQARALENGLVIEDLAVKSDGKMAAPGKKVSIKYTAKSRESGDIIDSNIDASPLKFRLGKGKVMRGLEVGVEGMRVGGKRRLTIPPSMAYESENAPKNSWLVYEIEVVKVR